MIRPDALESVSSDLAELASVLKARRLRRTMQTAMQRGQGPVLGLTAAIGASLVSAAAKEEEFDPLARLVAVDDLSALAELCLPGEAYAASDTHEHELTNAGHSRHAVGAFYLVDPFASPYANTHGRDHEDHERSTHTGEHRQTAHAEAHGQHAAIGGQQHHNGHAADVNKAHHVADHNAHVASAAVEHGDHAPLAGHASHGAGHIANSSAHAGHSASASPHGVAQAEHAAHAPEAGGSESEVEGAHDHNHDTAHAVSSPAPADMDAAAPSSQTTTDNHNCAHHHAGFGEFDLTPADDLATAATPPMI